MFEIYSEVVKDLLNYNKYKKEGLIIREDPKRGFYRLFFIFIAPKARETLLLNSLI